MTSEFRPGVYERAMLYRVSVAVNRRQEVLQGPTYCTLPLILHYLCGRKEKSDTHTHEEMLFIARTR